MRLRRIGSRKKPYYRIVVADQRTSRNGRFIELLGTYDPKIDPPVVKVDHEKVQKWLGYGAIPSDTVRALLVGQGLLDRKKAPEAQKPEPAPEAPKAKGKSKAAAAEPVAAAAEAPAPVETAAAEEPAVAEPAAEAEPAPAEEGASAADEATEEPAG